MANFEVEVAEDVIQWARETSGLTLDEAARKLKIDIGQLREWEAGVGNPKLSKLQQMAELYKRPLAVLLLPVAPKRFDVMRDFRLLDGKQERSYSRNLQLAFRRVEMQRSVARDLAELDGETPTALDIETRVRGNVEDTAQRIRSWLNSPASGSKPFLERDTLQLWIELIEDKDILVTQVQGVTPEEMRGCSMSGDPYPAIVLNGKDAKRGRTFTLLHELVHLTLHTGGVCNLEENDPKPRTENAIVEHFCNQVAAAVLMPRTAILAIPLVQRANLNTAWDEDQLWELAKPFGVSSEAFLLRLVGLQKASWDFYFSRRPHFQRLYAEAQEAPKGKGGPSFYQMKVRDFGRRYTTSVIDAYHRREINGAELADYLEIKVNHLPKLEETLGGRR